MSMRGVCDATAGDVLCGKVPARETGEMGVSFGGKTGLGLAMAAVLVGAASVSPLQA